MAFILFYKYFITIRNRCIIESAFSQIRVMTWVQVVCQKKKPRPLIGWSSWSTNKKLGVWRETAWIHVLTQISEKTDFSSSLLILLTVLCSSVFVALDSKCSYHGWFLLSCLNLILLFWVLVEQCDWPLCHEMKAKDDQNILI